MDIVLTLVVKPGSPISLEDAISVAVGNICGENPGTTHLSHGHAADLMFGATSIEAVKQSAAYHLNPLHGLDWCVQSAGKNRRKKMLIADMDSTMITIECIDELADFVGVKDKVSEITEAAMRGDLDFESALKERVALLKGLSTDDLAQCYKDRVILMPGAKTLLATMNANGAFSALVSGGFTFFTERVAKALGFSTHRSNQLGIVNSKLTGEVLEPICGAQSKLDALNEFSHQLDIQNDDVIAVGDGANDIPMLQAAGLGVAYHAKPKTITAAGAAIRFGDLRSLLYFQGYSDAEIVQRD